MNVARGGLYNEDALVDGLKSGKVRFAGIDVFAKEPATDHPLLDLPNVTVTPHLGANTKESQVNIAVQAAQNTIEVLQGSAYPNALNLPVKESDTPEWVTPYFELTQRMAFLASQVVRGVPSAVEVRAQGEVGAYLDSLLTFATVGALKEAVEDRVNYVNAPFVAKERGIETQTALEQGVETPFKNRVVVRISTDEESVYIGGTLFGDSSRIVDINGFDMDVMPKGKMILFKNNDVPGVIGKVGTLLGSHAINVADFRLGRDKSGSAMALILVDSKVPKAVLEELSALDEAISVAYAEI